MTYYSARELARSFRTVRKNTVTVAEDIPEGKYAFRPVPDSRSVAETLAHITVNTRVSYENYAVRRIRTFAGMDFVALGRERQEREKQLSTKAQLLDALRRDGEAWASYLDGVTEQELADEFGFPPGAEPPTKSRFELLLGVKEHEMHHRAQLMVIERLIGVVPHLTRERLARMAQLPSSKEGSH